MKTGVLFDLDGTLLDTLEDLTNAVNYTLNYYGCHPCTGKDVRAYVGNGVKQLLRLAVAEHGQGLDIDRVLETYKDYYSAHCEEKTAPYGGILEALAQISAKYPVGIVSNKPDYAVKKMCPGYFGQVYALGESPECPRKPAPDMLLKAMKELGMERCIYVGDTEVDIETARNAGLPCISVLWGFRDKPELEQAGGTIFCATPKDLLPLIEQLTEN